METKKFKDLEIKIEEESVHSEQSMTDTSTGGVGVDLRATITDNATEKTYTLFSGQVRGTGRYGDDFKHWYRDIEEIEEKDGEIHVTLTSGALKDTYSFNPINGNVRLEESIDLTELKKQEKMEEIIDGIDCHSLKEVIKDFGNAIKEKYKSIGTKEPVVLDTVIDEEQGIGVIALERNSSGYDPAIEAIDLYAVKQDGSFQELTSRNITVDHRPKFSSTYFKIQDLVLSDGKVKLIGKVMQSELRGIRWEKSTLEDITIERTINSKYRSIDKLLK